MKVMYVGRQGLDGPVSGMVYRIMFNEEAKKKFGGSNVVLWDDDFIVRAVEKENPYKGFLIMNPTKYKDRPWEIVDEES